MGFYDTTEQSRTHGRRLKTAYPRLDFVESGYRYYSPELGRWVSREPLGEWGEVNLYGFLPNHLLDRTDLLGLADVPPDYDGGGGAGGGGSENYREAMGPGDIIEMIRRSREQTPIVQWSYSSGVSCELKEGGETFEEFSPPDDKWGCIAGLCVYSCQPAHDPLGMAPSWTEKKHIDISESCTKSYERDYDKTSDPSPELGLLRPRPPLIPDLGD